MRIPSGGLRFLSRDGRFRFQLPATCVEQIKAICARAGRTETGGILVGYYTDDMFTAVVTEVIGPTSDSRAGPVRFFRGVRGLREFLSQIWKKERRYYLGEWHFHPYAPPTPSSMDRSQMEQIATTMSYNCPEPVLLIFGGDPRSDGDLSVTVFTQTGSSIELALQSDESTESSRNDDHTEGNA